jgi:hypothetical protein
VPAAIQNQVLGNRGLSADEQKLACHVLQKAALAALGWEQPPHRSSVCWRSQHLVDTVIHRKHPTAVRGLTVRHKDGSALPIQVFLFGLIIQLPPVRRDVDVFAKAASALANSNEGLTVWPPMACLSFRNTWSPRSLATCRSVHTRRYQFTDCKRYPTTRASDGTADASASSIQSTSAPNRSTIWSATGARSSPYWRGGEEFYSGVPPIA